ncbi:MAG: hypothetical protein COA62_05720 [Rhodobiaceae bacterium]|nr:MAG: hypothetical protein COA62_05720 [Rhodobiaceae bacterium]
MMQEVAENIWIEERPLKFHGLPFGTRMTVVKLTDGSLFVHSPVALTTKLKTEIHKLGDVAHIISPNKLHHLYMGEWQTAYPAAKIYASPGLRKKRRDLKFSDDLTDTPDPAWADDLDQLIFGGSFVMKEVVFFHRASRTLLIADLMEYFCSDTPFLLRQLTRLAGMYGRPIMPPDWRMTFWRRKTARTALARMLSWHPEQIILAHGKMIESEGEETLRRSFSWLTS